MDKSLLGAMRKDYPQKWKRDWGLVFGHVLDWCQLETNGFWFRMQMPEMPDARQKYSDSSRSRSATGKSSWECLKLCARNIPEWVFEPYDSMILGHFLMLWQMNRLLNLIDSYVHFQVCDDANWEYLWWIPNLCFSKRHICSLRTSHVTHTEAVEESRSCEVSDLTENALEILPHRMDCVHLFQACRVHSTLG